MTFPFRCPQGHVLQGEISQVGQAFQCPMCGSSFLIPPPEMGPVATGNFFQTPGTWPATNAPGPSFPASGGMPGMIPPWTMPLMPGGTMPVGPMSAGTYPIPPLQPIAFGTAAGDLLAPAPPALAAAPTETAASTSAPPPSSETAKPQFELGFDPNAKAPLPFEIPGQDEAEAEHDTAALPSAPPLPEPLLAEPSFPAMAPPAGNFPAAVLPAAAFEPNDNGQPLVPAAPAATDAAAPKVLHIRCPSGHLVKAKRDLLGKNGRCPACKKTFELRYEDSVEFQRRKEKTLRREEIKSNRAWVAWAFLAAFVVFAGLVALMLALSR